MGSPIDSSISAIGGAPFPFDFEESGGFSRRETEEICPAVGYVSDDVRPLQVIAASAHHPASAPQAVEATRPPGSSKLDKLYERDFLRLDRGLEVLKAQKHMPGVPKVLEGNLSAQIHVPSSVTQGYVPELGVLDVKAEGGVVCGSVLVERKTGVRK